MGKSPKAVWDLFTKLHDLLALGLGAFDRDLEACKLLDELGKEVNKALTPKRMATGNLFQLVADRPSLYSRLLAIIQATGDPEDAFLYLRYRCQELGVGMPPNRDARALCAKLAKSLEPPPKPEPEPDDGTNLFE